MALFSPSINHRLHKPGQSLVEFTLIVPILLLMCLGVAEMGRLWQTYHAAKLAAEDGAYTANKYDNAGQGQAVITQRLAQAKLTGGRGTVSAVSSAGGIILGYNAGVDVDFKPFFPGLTLSVPGYKEITLFDASIPIHYESIYSRKVM